MKKLSLMIVALLCAVVQGAWAIENTPFVQCRWDESGKVVGEDTITDKATISLATDDKTVKLEKLGNYNCYEVRGNVSIPMLDIYGEIHLILDNNATLTTQHIRIVGKENSLHIHRQVGTADEIGKLVVTGTGWKGVAGIFGSDDNSGNLYIHGGDIRVAGGENAKAITIGEGEGTLRFGNVRVYRGMSADTYAELHTTSSQRGKVCTRNQKYVRLVSCSEHNFICRTCGYCGLYSESAPNTVTYIDRTWDGNKVVETERSVEAVDITQPLPVVPKGEDDESDCDEGVSISGMTVYVSGEVDMSNYTLYNNVNHQTANIILCDESELKVHHLLMSGEHNRLHIYGQKNDAGRLIANEAKTSNGRIDRLVYFTEGAYLYPKAEGSVGIGNSSGQYVDMYFHGGNVKAFASSGFRNPAIGLGWPTNERGFIYVYGGTLEGVGVGTHSEGIGGDVDRVRIYGGNVIAQGSVNAAGIGGWYQLHNARFGSSTAVTIYGGTVTARGGEGAPGIGGSGSGGIVDIYDGTVNASGGWNGAGIGGGGAESWNIITITGGTINAYGGPFGAGIGGSKGRMGGVIRISGGNIHAYGGVDAAGIGGGEDGDLGSELTISGGTIYAESTGDDSNGPGIGSGEDGHAGNVSIRNGARVYAKGGSGSDGPPAIGSNSEDDRGQVFLGNALKVEAGRSESEIERRFTNGERAEACKWRRYAEITTCEHQTPTTGTDQMEAISYTIGSDNTHDIHCRYCNVTINELHNWVGEEPDKTCDKCGKTFNSTEDEWTVTIYQANLKNKDLAYEADYDGGTVYRVLKGTAFNIPELATVEGLSAQALMKDPAEAPTIIWRLDNETTSFDPSQPFTPTADTKLYARYRLHFTPEWEWGRDAEGLVNTNEVYVTLKNPLMQDDYTFLATVTRDQDYIEKTYIYDAKFTFKYHYPSYVGCNYNFEERLVESYLKSDIELQNNEDNYSILYEYEGHSVNVTLKDRVFIKDGKWNTLCLPFDLSKERLSAEDCPLRGVTIKQLSSTAYDNGTLTLNFTDTTGIQSGKPYLVKWDEATPTVVESPIFKNVTVTRYYYPIVAGEVFFYGSTNPVELAQEWVDQKLILYLGDDNKLYYPSKTMLIGAFRAFFYLAFAGENSATRPSSIVMNFGDEETTGIHPQPLPVMEGSGYYMLDGRRLSGKPTGKGLYIVNGKKMIVK